MSRRPKFVPHVIDHLDMKTRQLVDGPIVYANKGDAMTRLHLETRKLEKERNLITELGRGPQRTYIPHYHRLRIALERLLSKIGTHTSRGGNEMSRVIEGYQNFFGLEKIMRMAARPSRNGSS